MQVGNQFVFCGSTRPNAHADGEEMRQFARSARYSAVRLESNARRRHARDTERANHAGLHHSVPCIEIPCRCAGCVADLGGVPLLERRARHGYAEFSRLAPPFWWSIHDTDPRSKHPLTRRPPDTLIGCVSSNLAQWLGDVTYLRDSGRSAFLSSSSVRVSVLASNLHKVRVFRSK